MCMGEAMSSAIKAWKPSSHSKMESRFFRSLTRSRSMTGLVVFSFHAHR